jgi:hypothetical protein
MNFISSRKQPRRALAAGLVTTSLALAGAAWAGTALADQPAPAGPSGSSHRAGAAGPAGSSQPASSQPAGSPGPAGSAGSSQPASSQPAGSSGSSDKPSHPEFTVRAPNGTLVNRCMPRALHRETLSLRTADGIRLSAVVLGSGTKGVVLAHEQGYNICSWLSFGQTLAGRGYHVVVFEHRNHGASGGDTQNLHIDRDVMAGVQELTRRGVTRIVAGGASCGGTSSVVSAPKIPGFTGLIVMSSPRVCGGLNGLKVVRSVTKPSFFAFSPGDMTFEEEVRGLHNASGAKDKRLVIARGGYHGTEMLRRSEDGPMLRSKLLTFVADAFRAAD